MERDKKKVLHLVLYNPLPQYVSMYSQTKTWYKICEKFGVDTFYYFYDSDVSSPMVDEKDMTLRLPGTESYYPGILLKTLEAFEFFAKEGYDFIVRSNISSPVNFVHLLQHVPLENSMLYGGPHLINPALVETQRDNSIFKDLGSMKFVHGTCIVFGLDTIRFLLARRSELCFTIEDDFAFGVLLKRHNLEPTQIGGQYAFFKSTHNVDVVTCFRNHAVGTDRQIDIDAITHQVQTLMDRYVFLSVPQQVQTVLYHDNDITGQLFTLCNNIEGGLWRTDQGNIVLDRTFGDPCPNVLKILHIFFKDNNRSFHQRATLTFKIKNGCLWVH